MAGKEHFERLQTLIDLEREAEKQENLRELRKFPVSQREARGKTVSALIVDTVEGGMGGLTMVTLSRAPRGEELVPFHAMNAGDNVLLTLAPGNDFETAEGTLYKVEEYSATVALTRSPPDEAIRGNCQIDLLDYLRKPSYRAGVFPDDYWPGTSITASEQQWTDSIRAFTADLDAVEAFLRVDGLDLWTAADHAWEPAHTALRTVMVMIDHNAYHGGELAILRQVMGLWPSDRTDTFTIDAIQAQNHSG